MYILDAWAKPTPGTSHGQYPVVVAMFVAFGRTSSDQKLIRDFPKFQLK